MGFSTHSVEYLFCLPPGYPFISVNGYSRSIFIFYGSRSKCLQMELIFNLDDILLYTYIAIKLRLMSVSWGRQKRRGGGLIVSPHSCICWSIANKHHLHITGKTKEMTLFRFTILNKTGIFTEPATMVNSPPPQPPFLNNHQTLKLPQRYRFY